MASTAALISRSSNPSGRRFTRVNSSHNRSAPILKMLLQPERRSTLLFEGSPGARGFEWETTVFDVMPISYAPFGLLPQVHRQERDI